MDAGVGRLEVKNLSFAYPDGRKILEDISFSAEPGQIIGITGVVACGKSTLGKVFLCEYPYDGKIIYRGKDLQAFKDAERSQIIGYLGHDPELFSQGQWQLLSIARAAVSEQKLLLLDEITANLDAETEQEVLQALKRVSENRTVISISHRNSAEMGRIVRLLGKI